MGDSSDEVMAQAAQLSPLERIRLVERIMETREEALAQEVPGQSLRSLYGLWADLGVNVSEEDIAEARREMTSHEHRRGLILRSSGSVANTVSTRAQNEQQYPQWEDLPDGGRRYWYDRPGRVRGWARYVKIVDADEQTVSFVQEIYDDSNRLVARHEKYPVDTGHQVVTDEDAEESP